MTSSLLAELRRSADAETRRLAELLATLVPTDARRGSQPRATDTLAAFLAAQDSPYQPEEFQPPTTASDVVVVLTPATARPAPRRLAVLPARLRSSLLAKVALAAAVGLAGGGAVAATTGSSAGDHVVITPATPSGPPANAPADNHDEHEGQGHVGDANHPSSGTAASTEGRSEKADDSATDRVARHRPAASGTRPTAGSTSGPSGHDDGSRTATPPRHATDAGPGAEDSGETEGSGDEETGTQPEDTGSTSDDGSGPEESQTDDQDGGSDDSSGGDGGNGADSKSDDDGAQG
jgi:hypothetical protein